jgi:hypothetical protein
MGAGSSVFLGVRTQRIPFIIEESAAILTDPVGRTFFDGKEGDEKEAEVVIDSFLANLEMRAGRTDSCLPCQNDCFGLHAADKKEHVFTF